VSLLKQCFKHHVSFVLKQQNKTRFLNSQITALLCCKYVSACGVDSLNIDSNSHQKKQKRNKKGLKLQKTAQKHVLHL